MVLLLAIKMISTAKIATLKGDSAGTFTVINASAHATLLLISFPLNVPFAVPLLNDSVLSGYGLEFMKT